MHVVLMLLLSAGVLYAVHLYEKEKAERDNKINTLISKLDEHLAPVVEKKEQDLNDLNTHFNDDPKQYDETYQG